MADTFIEKYRPARFQDVVGQDAACKVLRDTLDHKRAQVFALTGPSGTGKTTLARLACSHVGIDRRNVLDVDAADNTGVDDMRKVIETMRYRPIGESQGRAAIIDECHRLSGNAWDSMLKATEEPKPGVYWFLCSTNPGKIPKTMMTRAVKVPLKLVSEKDLDKIVMDVVKAEDLRIGNGAIDVVIREAAGSPRQALSFLVACADADNSKEAMKLIHEIEDGDAVLEFCRFVVKPGKWGTGMDLLKRLKEQGQNPEGIRIAAVNYLAAVILNAKEERVATGMIPLLRAFATSYNSAEGYSPLMLSLYDSMFTTGAKSNGR